MAGTGECLAVRNKPGNQRSSEGCADALSLTLPRLNKSYENVLVRADADFSRKDIHEACEQSGAYFAFVSGQFTGRRNIADSVPEQQWKPFRTRAARQKEEASKQPGYRSRRKKSNKNLRRKRATERGYKELRQVKQWIAEVPWTPYRSSKTHRLIIRRQLIEHYEGQQFLLEEYRYRYIEPNLP